LTSFQTFEKVGQIPETASCILHLADTILHGTVHTLKLVYIGLYEVIRAESKTEYDHDVEYAEK